MFYSFLTMNLIIAKSNLFEVRLSIWVPKVRFSDPFVFINESALELILEYHKNWYAY